MNKLECDNQSVVHDLPFDPTCGFSTERLREVNPDLPEPPDFDDFWRRTHLQSQETDLEMELVRLDSDKVGFKVYKVFYKVFPDYRAGGWAVVPDDTRGVTSAMICGHGYGGREGVEWGAERADRIVFFSCAPGFQISADPRLPLNESWKHVLHGIETKESYILRSCAATLWRAVDVVERLAGGKPLPCHYVGWSFGGGIGALMLPWERRFVSAELGQPTFSWHPLRLRHESRGSAEAVRRHFPLRPEILRTLQYYEAVTSIRRVRVPVVFAVSLFDPAVAPPGQYAVANACPAPKRISEFLTGHFVCDRPSLQLENEAHARNIQSLLPHL